MVVRVIGVRVGGLRLGWRDIVGVWVYFLVGYEGLEGVGGFEVYIRIIKKIELLLIEVVSGSRWERIGFVWIFCG